MKYFIVLSLLVLTACEESRPLKTEVTNNPGYKVAFLFKKDNCAVYRFHDNGDAHYFVTCKGGSVEGAHGEQYGKTARTVYESIQTK